MFPNVIWNSAEHWSAWFTVLGGQSPTDTHGRSCHCGGGHGAECHFLSCAEAGCVSGKGRGPMQAGTSGKHQMQSRASMAVRGAGRRRTALWPSRAGSFHLTASRTEVLRSPWASVPGAGGQSLPPHPAAVECNHCTWEAAFVQTCDKGRETTSEQ